MLSFLYCLTTTLTPEFNLVIFTASLLDITVTVLLSTSEESYKMREHKFLFRDIFDQFLQTLQKMKLCLSAPVMPKSRFLYIKVIAGGGRGAKHFPVFYNKVTPFHYVAAFLATCIKTFPSRDLQWFIFTDKNPFCTFQRISCESQLADDVTWDVRFDALALFRVSLSGLQKVVKFFRVKFLET